MTYDDFLRYSTNTSNTARVFGITFKTTNEFLRINRLISRLNFDLYNKLRIAIGNKLFSEFFSKMYDNKIKKEELQKIISEFKESNDYNSSLNKLFDIITNKDILENIEKELILEEKNKNENKYTVEKKRYSEFYDEKRELYKPMNEKYEYRPWILNECEYKVSFKKIKLKENIEPKKEIKQEWPGEETKFDEGIQEEKIIKKLEKISIEEIQEEKIINKLEKLEISEHPKEQVPKEQIPKEQIPKEPPKEQLKPKLLYNQGKVFNPDTNRWVLVTGSIGKAVISKYS